MKERPNFKSGRGAIDYNVFLFPEDVTGKRLLNPAMNYVVKRLNPNRVKNNFTLYCLDERDSNHLSTFSRNEVYKRYGGQKEFFKKGATVLDLGSGGGKATTEYSLRLKGVKIIGVDTEYKDMNPMYPSTGLFVGGDWEKLPFKDNTFTGILGCESYPAGMGSVPENIVRTFREITRVSKEGAVWRATIPELNPLFDAEGEIWEAERRMITNSLAYNGWEAFIDKGIMIAKLEKKFNTT